MKEPNERYHAFDALRGSMMILGVLLHSATAYATIPDVWWLKDPTTSRWADLLILFIHSFRLPAFFVMAGFFAALLFARKGWQGFLENRAARLGLPFVLGMLVLYPPLRTTGVYLYQTTHSADPWAATLQWFQQGRFEKSIEPMHLWFIETLMLACLLAAALGPWLCRVTAPPWFSAVLGSRLAPLFWAVPLFFALVPMEAGILDTPHDFAPHLQILAAYFICFAFGWGLHENRHRLTLCARAGWPEIAFACVLMIPALTGLEMQLKARPAADWVGHLVTAASTALMCWCMIFGLIGLFLRKAAHPSPRLRYLSDSAYWIYLMHPPVLVAIQIPLMFTALPFGIKIALEFLLAVPILLWTYDRFVRSSWIGVILNGRRRPRGFPTAEDIPEPAALFTTSAAAGARVAE